MAPEVGKPRRQHVDHSDDWTVLDWKIFYAQITALREFWESRMQLSYNERKTLPPAKDERLPFP